VSRTRVLLVREFILLKGRIVNLPAKPHSEPFREHHEQDNTRNRALVHIYFLFIFIPSPSVTSKFHANCKHNFISRNYANQIRVMQCLFALVSTSAPNRGETPEFGIFVETEKYD
jgi:hypothetical protein